jgi:hypothetical protein
MEHYPAAQAILERALEGIATCSHMSKEAIDKAADGTAMAAWNEEGWGPEHSCTVLAKLPNKEWVVVNESEDTSGHGCMCDGNIAFFVTEEDAVQMGLDQDQRQEYLKHQKK